MSDRTPFLAGNWKMYKKRDQALNLAHALKDLVGDAEGRDVAVFPSFSCLEAVKRVLADSPIRVGAQTCHWETEGAFTGEVSAEMLVDAGLDMVLVGHSERREFFGETDEIVRKKLDAALRAGIAPILCLGETKDERVAERTEEVVTRQAKAAFEGLDREQMMGITMAYEPIWAIGTGLTATPEQAQDVHATLRGILAGMFDDEVAQTVRIQYGGSVKPGNIGGLMTKTDIDGALVGGASLEAGSFAGIVHFDRG